MSESGRFVLPAAAMRLRSETSIDPLLTVQYTSVRAIVRDVLRLYRAHFRTFAAIYLLPVVPFTIAGTLLREVFGKESAALQSTSFGLGLLGAIFAFAAVAVAMSDVCIGNRPSVRRSYRRIFGRRFGVIFANTILFFLAVLGIMAVSLLGGVLGLLIGFIPMSFAVMRYMFVPVISAVEPRPGVLRAFRRSAWLGHGYRTRAFATFLCIVDVGIVVAVFLYLAAGIGGSSLIVSKATTELLGALLESLVGLLIFPPLYIAAVLQYYDLRARKEGFRITELPEDIV